jgi:hypothetical protein
MSQSNASTIIASVRMQCIFANCLPGQRFAPLPKGSHEPSVPAVENSTDDVEVLCLRNRPGQKVFTGGELGAEVQMLESICPASELVHQRVKHAGYERLTGCRPSNNKSSLRYDPIHKTNRLCRLPDKHVMAAQPQALRKHSLQQRLLDKLVGLELEARCLTLLYLFTDSLE